MKIGILTTSVGTFAAAALLCLASGGASAQVNLGTGPGCSAIGGVDATTLQAGDYFTGRIGTTGVSGVNKNGGSADDSPNAVAGRPWSTCLLTAGFRRHLGHSHSEEFRTIREQ